MTTQPIAAAGRAAILTAARPQEADGRPVRAVRPRPLTVEDVMTRDVVTVAPTATFHQMIGLMRRRGISALPVVGEHGALLGIVSEADLLLKETPPPTQDRWVTEPGVRYTAPQGRRRCRRGRDDRAGHFGRFPSVARLRDPPGQYHRIKRLVVLDAENQLVGIVSRRDLLAGFSRSDAEIRSDVIEGVIPRWLWVDPAGIRVEVHGGVVRLEGTVDRRSDAEVLAHLVRR